MLYRDVGRSENVNELARPRLINLKTAAFRLPPKRQMR